MRRRSTFRAQAVPIAHSATPAHRSRSRRRTEAIESIPEPQAPGADPATVVAGADRSRAVREALARIPTERRQVIVLRFVDGLSSREIGVVLGRSPGAARVLLHRALADLAAELDHADL
jgi:RNA polymerase sigma-70 factor (ECF subfamily)